MGKLTVGHALVKYKGPFDYDGLYKLITNWISERRYELQEKRYKNKKATPAGYEIKLDLTGEKKETAYVRLWIIITIRSWDISEKEVDVNGEKKLMATGRIKIDIKTIVEFDWQKKFTGSKFNEAMGSFYQWVMKKEHEIKHIDAQEYEALALEHEVKKFLKMETDTHAY